LAAAVASNDAAITATALTHTDGTVYATVDAAKTAGVNTTSSDAVTAALTSADGTVHATVDAAITSNDAAVTTAATTTATAAAETTLMAGTGFASVSTLLAAYNSATASVAVNNATLTTGGDTVNGTAGNDTITGTQTTYTTGDLVVDASSADADVMTVTFTADSEAVPTIAGIETMNFNLEAVATAATGGIPGDSAVTFGMDLNGINGGNVVMDVTKAASTVTGIAVENVSDGTTITTDLTATRVTVEANADVTLNLTSATTNALTLQDGAGDNLTVIGSGSGVLTVADANAEEVITITNAGGGVTVSDLTAAADTLSSLIITAGGAVTITDSNNIGPVTATTTAGDMAIDTGTASTIVTLSTGAGDITVSDAADAATSLTATATGDADAAAAASDGDITVTDARLAETVTLTATGGIDVDNVNAAGTLVLTAGQASTISQDASDVETITIASNSSGATPVTFTSEDGDGTSNGTNDGLVELDTLNFTGSNSVTFLMPGDDLLLIQAEDTGAADTAAALVVSDTAMTGGTSRFQIDAAAGAATAINTRSMVVDEIALSYTIANNETFLVGSGQNIVVAADTTTGDINATAPAVAGNSLTVTIEDDAVATSANDVNGGITTSNIATLNIAALDAANSTAGGIVMGAVNVGTANAVVLTGGANMTVASATAASFNASAYTGALVVSDINQGGVAVFTGGSGADAFTSTADEDFSVDGGAGLDTLTLAAQDYSNNTVSIANIETIDVTASGITLAGSNMHNSSAVITGDAGGDTLNVLATTSTGETVNISNTATTATVTMTGLAGADSLTGSATTTTAFVGAAGSDVIVGGSAADTVTVLLEATAADGITLGGGSDSIVIDNASAAATIAPVLVTDFNAGTAASVVDTLTLDVSALQALTTVTALVDTNDVAITGNLVFEKLAADASTLGGTRDVVVLANSYATDAAALAGMATAGADTFTMTGNTIEANDAIVIAYYTGTHTNVAIATTNATSNSSDDFDSVETILTMQNVDATALLSTGDFIGTA
jgi:hypothetical protein